MSASLKTIGVLKTAVLVFVFLWFFLGSLAHFLFTKAEAGIIPGYIPFHVADVYISGICEMLGALGILWKKTRAAAGLGLVLLTIAVTPANVHMAIHWQAYPEIPLWILQARLIFQVFMVLGIAWSTSSRNEINRW